MTSSRMPRVWHVRLGGAGLLVVASACCVLYAGRTRPGDGAIGLKMREAIEWCSMRHIDADKDALPRVLLVGDSIVGAYADRVSKRLEGRVYCSWLTTSRCLGDPVFDQELELVLSQYDYAVIHFNNGLHGRAFSLDQYAAALERTLPRLQQTGATVIWRTSTPWNPTIDDYAAAQAYVDERNEAAAAMAHRFGIVIDDLAALTRGRGELFADRVHYLPAGIDLQARHVAEVIQEHLNEKGEQ